MLHLLNIALFVFHAGWVGFVCTGWIWRRTRLWQLIAVVLTAASWFGLGLVYGWGYCLCTDWHWQVRDRLGYPHGYSYIELILQTAGIGVPAATVDGITATAFLAVALLGIALNVRDFRRRRAASRRVSL
jgi:hypothetical protein